MFLNLYYLADPCFRNHNFSDFWNESGYAPVTQEPEWRIEGYIHASYQPDSQRPERFNGFPPDFDPIFPFTLSDTCCDTFVRTHPELPIARRDYFLSKAFQFLYATIVLRYWPNAESLTDPMVVRGASEIREVLQRSLDRLSDQDLPRLCAPELDWWWAVYSDTLNYNVDRVLKGLEKRFRYVFKSAKRSEKKAAPKMECESEIETPQASHLDVQPGGDSTTTSPAVKEVDAATTTDRSAAPVVQETERATGEAPNKGDFELLRGKEFVNVAVARQYLGVTRRAVEKAINKKALDASGYRLNRRISVASLCKYLPPQKIRTDAN